MELKLLIVVGLCVCYSEFVSAGNDCEVCIGFLTKFLQKPELDTSSEDRLEAELMKTCKDAKGKDEKFCYYIGASEIAATKLIRSVTKPMTFGKPVEKICKDLKKQDGEICELKYEKVIDFSTNPDLSKLRVKELKKVLNSWGEDCRGCAEKVDYINKINAVKSQHIEL